MVINISYYCGFDPQSLYVEEMLNQVQHDKNQIISNNFSTAFAIPSGFLPPAVAK